MAITRRNFITGLLASASGLLGACSGWFGRKAVETMATGVIFGTYVERLAASVSDGQWWYQTDVGLDGATTYAVGYYLYNNSMWGFFGDTVGDPRGLTVIDSSYPAFKVIGLSNKTDGGGTRFNRFLHRTSQDMVDNFNSGLNLSIQDDTSEEIVIGSIAAYRQGADDQGKVIIGTRRTGGSDYTGAGVDGVHQFYANGKYLSSQGTTSNQVASSSLMASQISGVTVANSVAETTLTSWGFLLTGGIDANFFNEAGPIVRLTARGYMGTTGTPTLNIKARIDGAAVISTGAVTTSGTISNNYWECVVDYSLRSVGAGGTLQAQGVFNYDNSNHTGQRWGMVATSTTAFNTTTAHTFDLSATWGTQSSSNTITCTNMTLELIG